MGATLAGTLIAIILMLVIAYLLVDRSIERKRRIESEGKLEALYLKQVVKMLELFISHTLLHQ